MEEKRKKEKRKNFAAKKNELKILEKKLVSQKRSNGSDWYRGKKIVSGEDMETRRRVCQKIK
mgnify:FL=1